MITQFIVHLNFLQDFCVHSRPLTRSAAHPQLRVLWGLKHSLRSLFRRTVEPNGIFAAT